jgi:hypothetical protein
VDATPAEESRQVVVERVVREVVRESRTDPSPPARDETPARPRVRSSVAPARTAVPAPKTAAPEPAPDIHVSVGRIEVRAVSPVPQRLPEPQAQPSRVPAPTLEDYLQDLGSHR